MRSLVFILIFTTLIHAELSTQDLLDMSIDELLNIKVTSASKKIQTILQSPSAIEIITKEELELLKCNRLSECLEFATGISSVNGEGNIFNTSTIRGNTLVNYNTNTLLLIDGVPVLNSYHGSFNLDMVPLSSISQIEIVKGANSVLYGSNAINGVINIITIDDNDQVMAKIRYGSFNTLHLETRGIYNYKDGSLSLFADRTQSDEETFTIEDENGKILDFAQGYETDALMAKATYKAAWMQLQFYDKRLDNYKTRGFSAGTPLVDAKEGNTEKEYLVALGYRYEINNDFILKMQSSYHNWELEKTRYNGVWDYESYDWYNELELHMFNDSKSNNILGMSYQVGNARRFKSEKDAFDIGLNNEKTLTFSIYDNGNYQINDTWNLVYGGRYFSSDYYDATQAEHVHNNNLSLRGGLIYSVQDNMALKLLYAQAYRVPTYFEKEVNSAKVKGNANLQPENSESYDLIFVHQLHQFPYTVDLFYTKIHNKITRVDLGDGTSQNQNSGNVDFYGLEINTKFKFDESFWGFAGYSYATSDHKGHKDNAEKKKFTYENMFTLGLSKKAFNDVTFNTSLKYLDSWAGASSYVLMNASVEYEVLKGLSIEALINNIFDEEINVPEIARDKESVPTVPKDYSTRFYFGMKYLF